MACTSSRPSPPRSTACSPQWRSASWHLPTAHRPVVEARVVEAIDTVVASLPPSVQKDLGTGLWLLENALTGAVLDQRFTTFSAASVEVQRRILREWAESSIETKVLVYRGLHQMVTGSYWSNPATYHLMGYRGPPDYGQSRAPDSPRRFDGRPPTSQGPRPPSRPYPTTPSTRRIPQCRMAPGWRSARPRLEVQRPLHLVQISRAQRSTPHERRDPDRSAAHRRRRRPL